jgi:(p)ppGpp synthase/HD superfamily hydrolase
MKSLEEIRNFAKQKHEGQFRRDGVTPYFTHCEKVASLVDSEFEKSLAYCHDLIEDKRCNIRELKDAFNDIELVDCVLNLTKNNEETYEQYIKRISIEHYIIKRVKIADIVANLSDNPTTAQVEKYNKALKILVGI